MGYIVLEPACLFVPPLAVEPRGTALYCSRSAEASCVGGGSTRERHSGGCEGRSVARFCALGPGVPLPTARCPPLAAPQDGATRPGLRSDRAPGWKDTQPPPSCTPGVGSSIRQLGNNWRSSDWHRCQLQRDALGAGAAARSASGAATERRLPRPESPGLSLCAQPGLGYTLSRTCNRLQVHPGLGRGCFLPTRQHQSRQWMTLILVSVSQAVLV